MISGLLGVALLGLLAGCIWQSTGGLKSSSCTRQIFAMDTVMSFTAYGKNCEEAVDAAIEEVKRLDSLLSAGDPDSEISWLNAAGVSSVSEDAAALFERALAVYETTGGLFDVSIYPLMELWGFPAGEYHVPTKEELEEVLPLVDASQIKITGSQVRLGEGQRVDLGGIAKGYASARVMEIYEQHGVRSGMVSLGGNVQVLKRKPDGSGFRIGIRDPKGDSADIVAVVEVEDCAVVTSGGYERYFEENGNTYIHILDPGTGYPVEGDLASVTVVSEDGMLADALSTALYIMGLEDALAYWRDYGENFELVLITETGELYATEGLENCLEASGGFRLLERDG